MVGFSALPQRVTARLAGRNLGVLPVHLRRQAWRARIVYARYRLVRLVEPAPRNRRRESRSTQPTKIKSAYLQLRQRTCLLRRDLTPPEPRIATSLFSRRIP